MIDHGRIWCGWIAAQKRRRTRLEEPADRMRGCEMKTAHPLAHAEHAVDLDTAQWWQLRASGGQRRPTTLDETLCEQYGGGRVSPA